MPLATISATHWLSAALNPDHPHSGVNQPVAKMHGMPFFSPGSERAWEGGVRLSSPKKNPSIAPTIKSYSGWGDEQVLRKFMACTITLAKWRLVFNNNKS